MDNSLYYKKYSSQAPPPSAQTSRDHPHYSHSTSIHHHPPLSSYHGSSSSSSSSANVIPVSTNRRIIATNVPGSTTISSTSPGNCSSPSFNHNQPASIYGGHFDTSSPSMIERPGPPPPAVAPSMMYPAPPLPPSTQLPSNVDGHPPDYHYSSGKYNHMTAPPMPPAIGSSTGMLEKYFTAEELKRFAEYNRFLVMSSPGRQKKFYASLSSTEYKRFNDYLDMESKNKSIPPPPIPAAATVAPPLSGSSSVYHREMESNNNTSFASSYSFTASSASSFYGDPGLESESTNNHSRNSRSDQVPSTPTTGSAGIGYYRRDSYPPSIHGAGIVKDFDYESKIHENYHSSTTSYSPPEKRPIHRSSSATGKTRNNSRSRSRTRQHPRNRYKPTRTERIPIVDGREISPSNHEKSKLSSPNHRKRSLSKERSPKRSERSEKSLTKKSRTDSLDSKQNEVKILEERIKLLEKKLERDERKIEERISIRHSRSITKERDRDYPSSTNQKKSLPSSKEPDKISPNTLEKAAVKKQSKTSEKNETKKEKDSKPKQEKLELPTAEEAEMKNYKIPKKCPVIESKKQIPEKSTPAKSSSDLAATEAETSESRKLSEKNKSSIKKPDSSKIRKESTGSSIEGKRHLSPLKPSYMRRLTDEEIMAEMTSYHWCNLCHLFFTSTTEYLYHIHRDRHFNHMSNSDFITIKKAEEKINNNELGMDSKISLAANCSQQKLPELKHSSSGSSADSETSIVSQINCDKEQFFGTEFLYPLVSFYCDLCSKFSFSHRQAQDHLKSEKHLILYKKYAKKNVDFYKKFNDDRLREFKRSKFFRDVIQKVRFRRIDEDRANEEIKELLDSIIQRVVRKLEPEKKTKSQKKTKPDSAAEVEKSHSNSSSDATKSKSCSSSIEPGQPLKDHKKSEPKRQIQEVLDKKNQESKEETNPVPSKKKILNKSVPENESNKTETDGNSKTPTPKVQREVTKSKTQPEITESKTRSEAIKPKAKSEASKSKVQQEIAESKEKSEVSKPKTPLEVNKPQTIVPKVEEKPIVEKITKFPKKQQQIETKEPVQNLQISQLIKPQRRAAAVAAASIMALQSPKVVPRQKAKQEKNIPSTDDLSCEETNEISDNGGGDYDLDMDVDEDIDEDIDQETEEDEDEDGFDVIDEVQ